MKTLGWNFTFDLTDIYAIYLTINKSILFFMCVEEMGNKKDRGIWA